MPKVDANIVYMKIALEVATMSYAERKQVGAILVKDGNILSMGFNGTPKGFDNVCEEPEMIPYKLDALRSSGKMVTKKEVLHAESNAISKCAKSTDSSEDSDLYVTMSPCFECSKLIIQAGIKHVFYLEKYRDGSGLELLKKANIPITQINL